MRKIKPLNALFNLSLKSAWTHSVAHEWIIAVVIIVIAAFWREQWRGSSLHLHSTLTDNLERKKEYEKLSKHARSKATTVVASIQATLNPSAMHRITESRPETRDSPHGSQLSSRAHRCPATKGESLVSLVALWSAAYSRVYTVRKMKCSFLCKFKTKKFAMDDCVM